MVEKTDEPVDEIADFQQSFHDARFQRSKSDEADEPEEKVTLETETEPEETPVEEAAPAEEPTAEAAPDEGEPDPQQDPQVKLYTVPDHEMYGALRGQKVTAAQLEEAGLIGKVITRDHQEMHNTKLYNDLKREFEEKLAAAKAELTPKQPTEDAKPIDPKDFGDRIVDAYVPSLKKLADAGAFEPDIIEAYPRFVAHVAHQLESMRLVGAGLVQGFQEMSGWANGQQSTSARESGMAALHGAMDNLAQDELYAPLRDADEKQRFIDWMSDKDNPQPWKKMDIASELSRPDVIAGAFAAYRAATRGSRPAAAATPPASATREKARMAASTGGVPRAPKREGEKNEFDSLRDDILKSRAAAFGRG